jgi:hypothetical protein
MASSYVNDLRLNEMATGDASGTWGETTNTNLELIAEAFSYGTEAITTNADTHTTTIADGATDPGRALYLKYTGTLDSACTITIGPNTVSKVWIVENGTSGSQDIILSQGSGANITIPAGDTKVVYSDGAGAGAAFFDAFASLSVVDLKVQDDLTVTDDMTVGGTLGVTGVLTANAGVVVDNFTLDGTTLALSSGDMTLDAAGVITLDADDAGEVRFLDGGTQYAQIKKDGNNALFQSIVADGDFVIQGIDGASFISALTFDMSEAGAATFNSTVTVPTNLFVGTSIVHQGDSNTSIDFQPDVMDLYSGGSLGVRVQPAAVTINETGGDSDFRVESNTNTHALFVQGSDGNVGIGTSTITNPYSQTNHTDVNINGTWGGVISFKLGGVTKGWVGQRSSGNEDMVIGATTGQELLFYANNAEAARINGGNLLVGKTAISNTTKGATIDPSGEIGVTLTNAGGGSQCIFLNRQDADGDLILFRQANSTEGSISVSGATVSYNGFSGNHETSGISTDTEIGTVCSTIDELDTYTSGTKEGQTRADHAKIKVSDTVGDTRVYGVLTSYSETDNKPVVASVGIGSIKVTGACSGGDLLESNGDGTAKVQSDDIVRSKTIGKVTIGNSDTGVKLVSCVLYCG